MEVIAFITYFIYIIEIRVVTYDFAYNIIKIYIECILANLIFL